MSTNNIGNLNQRINFLQMTSTQKSRQLQNINQNIQQLQQSQMSEQEITATYGGDNKFDALNQHQQELDAMHQQQLAELEMQKNELENDITATQQEIEKTQEQLQEAEAQKYLEEQAQEMQAKLEETTQSSETRDKKMQIYDNAKQLASAQGFTLPEGTDVVQDEDGNFVLKATVGEGDWAETITAKNATELKKAYDEANQTQVVVQDGETLRSMADRYGVTTKELIEANPDLVQHFDIKDEFGENTGRKVAGFTSGQEITVPKKLDPALVEGNLSADEARAITDAKIQTKASQTKAADMSEAEFLQLVQEHAENTKLQEENQKLIEEGKQIAGILYEDIDGIGSGDLLENLEEKVTKDNVADVILGYREFSPDESLSEAIMDEIGLGGENTEKALNGVFSKLVDKAKEQGIDTAHFEEQYNAILGKNINEKKWNSDNYLVKNHDELDGVFEGMAAAIKGTNIPDSQKAAIEATSFEEQKNETLARLDSDLSTANENFEKQLDKDGFIAKTYDSLNRLAGSEHDKTDIAANLEEYQEYLSELNKCQTEEEFNAKFKEIFGVEYDPVLVDNYINKQDQFAIATANHIREQSFNNNQGINDLLNDTLGYNGSKTLGRGYQKPEQKYDSALDALAKELCKVETEDGTIYDMETAYAYIESKFTAAGFDMSIDNIHDGNPEKYELLKDIANEYKEYLHQQTLDSLDGRSLEALRTEMEGSYNAAFGITNDISREVQNFCTAQNTATAIGRTGLKTAAAVTLAVATGGTALPLMAAGTAVSSFGIDSIDSLTSADGVSKEELLKYGKNAIIDGVTTYLGGSLGKGLSEASTLTKLAAATPGNIAIGAGAEYLKTGQVTIQGVVCNGIFGASGTLQAIKMGGKIIQVPPGFKNFTTATNKIAQGTIASANN